MKQEFENIRSTVKCNDIDNLSLPLALAPCYCLSTEMFFDNDDLPVAVFLDIFLVYLVEPNIQVHLNFNSED